MKRFIMILGATLALVACNTTSQVSDVVGDFYDRRSD